MRTGSVIYKAILFFLMTAVLTAGLAFPVVQNPEHWWQFPYIAGLDEKIRIIIFHVPTAWLSVMAFAMTALYGIKYLRFGMSDDDAKAYSAAQLGFTFCILATITGSIWAKFSWGSFWNWDPRETSIFFLLLIYGAFFALRSAIEDEEKKARLSAVYLIFAFVTVPFFVFIMPRIAPGLHPGSLGDTTQGPVISMSISSSLLFVFLFSIAAFTMLFFWIWSVNSRSIILSNKIRGDVY